MDDELRAAMELTSEDLRRMEAEGEPAEVARTRPDGQSNHQPLEARFDPSILVLENLRFGHADVVGDQSRVKIS